MATKKTASKGSKGSKKLKKPRPPGEPIIIGGGSGMIPKRRVPISIRFREEAGGYQHGGSGSFSHRGWTLQYLLIKTASSQTVVTPNGKCNVRIYCGGSSSEEIAISGADPLTLRFRLDKHNKKGDGDYENKKANSKKDRVRVTFTDGQDPIDISKPTEIEANYLIPTFRKKNL